MVLLNFIKYVNLTGSKQSLQCSAADVWREGRTGARVEAGFAGCEGDVQITG